MWSFKSYFNTVWCGASSASINFDQSLKLGVKMGIRKMAHFKNRQKLVELKLLLTTNSLLILTTGFDLGGHIRSTVMSEIANVIVNIGGLFLSLS
jgi:hypothetical protein